MLPNLRGLTPLGSSCSVGIIRLGMCMHGRSGALPHVVIYKLPSLACIIQVPGQCPGLDTGREDEESITFRGILLEITTLR